jgi:hypothetical protein
VTDRVTSPSGFYLLEPEVAGGWGANIKVHRQSHPPVVTHMHYEFQGWLGDDLLTTFPEFIVTERLAMALDQSALTGFELAAVEVSPGDMWEQCHPTRPLPQCRWLKMTGPAGKEDFGRTELADLVVSHAALELLRGFAINDCEVRPWTA